MFEFSYQQGTGRKKSFRIAGDVCLIGNARDSDLMIKSRSVAKRHAEIYLTQGNLHIKDLGSSSGTWVNRQRIRQHGPLSELDEIVVGDVFIRVNIPEPPSVLSTAPSLPYSFGNAEVEQSTEHLHESSSASGAGFSGAPTVLTADAGERHSQRSPSAGRAQLNSESEKIRNHDAIDGVHTSQSQLQEEELSYWGGIIHEQFIQQMDLRRKDVHRMTDVQLRDEALQLIADIVERMAEQMPVRLDTNRLTENVLNEAVGLGPLEQFLKDESISEIMVNNHQEIFVEKAGKLQKSPYSFSSDAAVYAVIERIITPLGRRVDEGSPIVDARLKDGSRVNAVIPPLALKGPSLTIRKFSDRRLHFSDLIARDSVSEAMVGFLRICVERHKNIVVSGGTGSGKTTLLNVLSNFIPDSDRIVTIEDAAELKLVQPNLVSLESRPPNLEGRGEISIRDLVKNALRMRPDRIVVGECRGGEAIDMLQAMNTGHDGSLTTIHANNPRDVISRLEVLVLMAGMELPVVAIREQIASAVDIIIQQSRFPCGSRKITKVTEVVGVEGATVQLQDLFEYRQSGIDDSGLTQGAFCATGFIPSFYEPLRQLGVTLDLDLFNSGFYPGDAPPHTRAASNLADLDSGRTYRD